MMKREKSTGMDRTASTAICVGFLTVMVLAVGCGGDGNKQEKTGSTGVLKGAVSLSPELQDIYTIEDTTGLSDDLHAVQPLWEKVRGGFQHSPMTVMRLYADGRYYSYDNKRNNDEYKWSLIGTISDEAVKEVRKILLSDEFTALRSNGGDSPIVGNLDLLVRTYVNGESRELIYARSVKDLPDLFSLVWRKIVRGLE